MSSIQPDSFTSDSATLNPNTFPSLFISATSFWCGFELSYFPNTIVSIFRSSPSDHIERFLGVLYCRFNNSLLLLLFFGTLCEYNDNDDIKEYVKLLSADI